MCTRPQTFHLKNMHNLQIFWRVFGSHLLNSACNLNKNGIFFIFVTKKFIVKFNYKLFRNHC